ncbi:hypothetical protein BDY21DRAFT_368027 [Lineolata rhizophorae]|uniref:VWFA domain-containing protein n=1 Tax=Lineolata rhizophorae TaxID=578093 RepID=A0A6A6PD14_9PEZI|nr:hypothetical protein BDY21DRAFT_368027 [Lineolata rhizophorae]
MNRRNSFLGKISRKFGSSSSNASKGPNEDASPKRKSFGSVLSPGRSNDSTRWTPGMSTRRPNRAGMNAFTTPSNEPPPAYTPNPAPGTSASGPAASTSRPSAAATAHMTDDRYDFLKTFDTIVVIDDSGSMAGRSWRETAGALETIAPIVTTYDSDGIDIYFLNAPDKDVFHNVTVASTVREIFSTVRPTGATPTGQRLNSILKKYFAALSANEDIKPLNIIVVTDGVPTDDLESVLVWAAKKLDSIGAPAWQVGVQFFQVGNEMGAAQHLQQLDDEMRIIANGPVRDIVDTVPFTGQNGSALNADGILKVVLGAVHRRLDRTTGALHRTDID